MSSWRMAAFGRSCSMALRRSFASRLFIPPDIGTDLVIELKPVRAWFSSADEGLRLLPPLTGNAKVRRVDFEELGTPADGIVHDFLSRLAND